MFFQTSTPKKRTLIPLPRSSTPNKSANLLAKKIKDQARIASENSNQYPMIKLDALLYRPRTESYHHQNIQQFWDI